MGANRARALAGARSCQGEPKSPTRRWRHRNRQDEKKAPIRIGALKMIVVCGAKRPAFASGPAPPLSELLMRFLRLAILGRLAA